MAAHHLAARTRQPGHDRTFLSSESAFITAARLVLPGCCRVVAQPRDLATLFRPARPGGRAYGVIPEAAIVHDCTGLPVYVEVKRQGHAGNAEERAAKHHTVAFYRTLAQHLGVGYHAYVTVFCDALATDERYLSKYPYLYESGQWLAWAGYDLQLLGAFLNDFRRRHLGPCARSAVPVLVLPGSNRSR